MKTCPKKVTETYHYPKGDCGGDYYSADVSFDGKIVFALGDDYHDKASKQIEGFLEACRLIWGENFPVVKIRNVDDAEQ